MSIEKSHSWDRNGSRFDDVMDGFRAFGSNHLGEEGKHGTSAARQSAVFYGPLRSAGKRFE
jgi:hypothetical protein